MLIVKGAAPIDSQCICLLRFRTLVFARSARGIAFESETADDETEMAEKQAGAATSSSYSACRRALDPIGAFSVPLVHLSTTSHFRLDHSLLSLLSQISIISRTLNDLVPDFFSSLPFPSHLFPLGGCVSVSLFSRSSRTWSRTLRAAGFLSREQLFRSWTSWRLRWPMLSNCGTGRFVKWRDSSRRRHSWSWTGQRMPWSVGRSGYRNLTMPKFLLEYVGYGSCSSDYGSPRSHAVRLRTVPHHYRKTIRIFRKTSAVPPEHFQLQ